MEGQPDNASDPRVELAGRIVARFLSEVIGMPITLAAPRLAFIVIEELERAGFGACASSGRRSGQPQSESAHECLTQEFDKLLEWSAEPYFDPNGEEDGHEAEPEEIRRARTALAEFGATRAPDLDSGAPQIEIAPGCVPFDRWDEDDDDPIDGWPEKE